MSHHIGRAWTGHAAEDACPCPQAPCGLAIMGAGPGDCPEHGWVKAKSMRQIHDASDCPARQSQEAAQ